MARAPLLLLLPLLAALLAPGANAAGRKMVGVYELRKGDFSAKVTNWGATVTSIVFPDSKGMSWDFGSVHLLGSSDAFVPAIRNSV